jgi:hypothetical protein
MAAAVLQFTRIVIRRVKSFLAPIMCVRRSVFVCRVQTVATETLRTIIGNNTNLSLQILRLKQALGTVRREWSPWNLGSDGMQLGVAE